MLVDQPQNFTFRPNFHFRSKKKKSLRSKRPKYQQLSSQDFSFSSREAVIYSHIHSSLRIYASDPLRLSIFRAKPKHQYFSMKFSTSYIYVKCNFLVLFHHKNLFRFLSEFNSDVPLPRYAKKLCKMGIKLVKNNSSLISKTALNLHGKINRKSFFRQCKILGKCAPGPNRGCTSP